MRKNALLEQLSKAEATLRHSQLMRHANMLGQLDASELEDVINTIDYLKEGILKEHILLPPEGSGRRRCPNCGHEF